MSHCNHDAQAARQGTDRTARSLQDRLDRETARASKLEEQANALKTLTAQLRSDIKVEITTRKQLEKERSALQKELEVQRAARTRDAEGLHATFGRDLRAERAARQRAEFALREAVEARRAAEEGAARLTLAARDATQLLEAEKVRCFVDVWSRRMCGSV